jgi:hypothetical protein
LDGADLPTQFWGNYKKYEAQEVLQNVLMVVSQLAVTKKCWATALHRCMVPAMVLQ